MSAQALRQALRVRRYAIAMARTEIAGALEMERVARAALADVRDTIRREIDTATKLNVGDIGVDALGRWLKGARTVETGAKAALDVAEAATARARAGLAAARTAEAAVTELIEAAENEAAKREQRSAQADLDQAAEHYGAHPASQARRNSEGET